MSWSQAQGTFSILGLSRRFSCGARTLRTLGKRLYFSKHNMHKNIDAVSLSFFLSPCPLYLPSVSPSSPLLTILSLPDYQPPWDSSLSLPWPLVLDLRPSGDSASPVVSLPCERIVLVSLPLCLYLSLLSYLVECELDLCLLCVCLIVLCADLHGGEVMWLQSYLFGSMELTWCPLGSILSTVYYL